VPRTPDALPNAEYRYKAETRHADQDAQPCQSDTVCPQIDREKKGQQSDEE